VAQAVLGREDERSQGVMKKDAGQNKRAFKTGGKRGEQGRPPRLESRQLYAMERAPMMCERLQRGEG
jgi:hypothetical protein